jgi:hypothetical protein
MTKQNAPMRLIGSTCLFGVAGRAEALTAKIYPAVVGVPPQTTQRRVEMIVQIGMMIFIPRTTGLSFPGD